MRNPAKQHGLATGASGTRTRAVWTGMAVTVLCVVAGLLSGEAGWFYSAATVLAVNMACPRAFAPVTTLWFGLCSLLIQGIAFFLLLPVDLLRRAAGKAPLDVPAIRNRLESLVGARCCDEPPQDVQTPL
jgi:hypothetical protein